MTPDDSFRVIRFGQTADQNKTALLKEKRNPSTITGEKIH